MSVSTTSPNDSFSGSVSHSHDPSGSSGSRSSRASSTSDSSESGSVTIRIERINLGLRRRRRGSSIEDLNPLSTLLKGAFQHKKAPVDCQEIIKSMGSIVEDFKAINNDELGQVRETLVACGKEIIKFLKDLPSSDLTGMPKILLDLQGELQDLETTGEIKKFAKKGYTATPGNTPLVALYQNFLSSDAESISAFAEQLEGGHPQLLAKFKELQQLVFPRVGMNNVMDFVKLLSDDDLAELPHEFRQFADQIRKLEGDPTGNLVGAAMAFFFGFAPLALMGATLNATSMSLLMKFFIGASPTLPGAVMRFWAGQKADVDGGRDATLQLLWGGTSGIALLLVPGIFLMGDLSLVTNVSYSSYGLFWSAMVAGLGIATFPASMSIAAATGRGSDAGPRQGITAGLGNIAPGLFVMLLVGLTQGMLAKGITAERSLQISYCIWACIAILGSTYVTKVLKDPLFHQLKKKGIPEDKARDVAKWLGQDRLPDTREISKKLGSLTADQKTELILACCTYGISFGLFLTLTATLGFDLKRKGFNPVTSALLTATFSLVSSLVRSVTGLGPIKKGLEGLSRTLGSKQPGLPITLGGLGLFGTGMAFYSLLDNRVAAISLAIILGAVGNGMASYGVFKRISEKNESVGVVAGQVGGWGALPGLIFALVIGGLTQALSSEDENDEPLTSYPYLIITALCFIMIVGYGIRALTHKKPKVNNSLTDIQIKELPDDA